MQSKVGTRIRSFREKTGLSLEDLASQAGLTAEYLVQVEEQGAVPPLGALVKLARALGCRLGTFIDDELSSDPFIVRLAERQSEPGAHACADKSPALTFYSLGKGKADRNMEPFFIELEPCTGPEGDLSSHEGEEFIVVVSGEVRLVYGDKTHILTPGDSMYYNSVVPHRVECAGAEKAQIYAVIYIPS